MQEKNLTNELKQKQLVLTIQIIFVLMICSCFAIWAWELPYNQAPDEMMRYQIPTYIFNHSSLPTGYDQEAIYILGNWSYAFYPQMLGAIISAFFMQVMNLFRSTPEALLWAARLTSVLFGGITVFFTGKSIYKLSNNLGLSLLGMGLLGFLPQFTFLSCYVNNDVIAAAGASMIVYTMIATCFEPWRYRHSIYLSLGFIICALGYLNSYSFILVGGIFFLLINFFNIKHQVTDKKVFYKNFALIFCLSALAIFPFLIRNYLLYKDFFGMQVFHEEYMKWVAENGTTLQKPYELGNLLAMLTDPHFKSFTLQSFIGFFGYMSIRLDIKYYQIYYCLFGTGILAFVVQSIQKHFQQETPNLVIQRKRIAFILIMLGCLITFGLHWYYCLKIDYQPQGRYIMAIVAPFIIMITFGFEKIINFFIQPTKKSYIYLFILMSYILINVLIHNYYFLLSQNI
ncbi:hypothetical protein M2139_001326 [Enterococcus sp. PF1-24]|uniref:hypothetical protein n=1 Tax=unclassified Enterococcus TaxID=2608891 RepID=UPI002476439F|nr:MULTISPECIES: hypothetical protein [unclassified Enterococcus]MDH6364369.1 hypothetical protein [Enterococcus sp. PFB1-1]MDH6401442.1 hypothetical protein [Enterococcus sp. PF1-24]